ncbi:MAG: hypothetical protein K2X45_14590 [Phreatobacter sp.]|nr:hypothetical protein [Phreatobacter sp.]
MSLALAQALRWSGFRHQSPAALASGPFAVHANETVLVRLDPATYTIAFVTRLDIEADLVRFVDHQGLNAWGYDLNREGHADQTVVVNELRFVIARDDGVIATELHWHGYALEDGNWVHVDSQCTVPALGPGFTAPIYPCLGWVLLPGAIDAFGAAERRQGFCTTEVPAGAAANHATRSFSFVYDGYAQRRVIRRRIVTLVDPARPAAVARMLVGNALVPTYQDP